MKKIFVIAIREYNAVVRTKAFILSIVLLPVMMFGSIALQSLGQKVHDVNDRRFAIIDRTPGRPIYSRLSEDVQKRNDRDTLDPATHKQVKSKFVLENAEPAQGKDASDQQRFELSERVRKGELSGVLEIGEAVFTSVVPRTMSDPPDSDVVRYQTNNPTSTEFRDLARDSINRTVRNQRLASAGVAPEKFAELSAQVQVLNRGQAHKDDSGGISYAEAGRDVVAFLLPLGLVFLMFMVVIIGAVPLLQGIIEEKQQRIAEVLLGSVSPFVLMAGKVLGLVATSFTLILVYLGGAYFAAHRLGLVDYLPAQLLAWFILFQFLSVLMYGSLYIAVGAACNDTKEMQSMLMPVNLLMALPLLMMLAIVQSPSGPLARGLTFFPPATPFVMVARLAVPPGVSAPEKIAAIAMVLAMTFALIWASSQSSVLES